MALTPQSKNTTTMNPLGKAGAGWHYDDANITYDMVSDAEGRSVLYDGLGSQFIATPQSKNSVSLSGQSKNSI